VSDAGQPARRGFEPYQSGTLHFAACCYTHAALPAAAGARRAMKNQGKASNSGVIVVSDDLAVRNSLKFWLEIEGLTVRGYVSGANLLDAGDLAHCDCYVVDQKMSAMSGLDLIAQLRDRHFTAPAILIASHPSRSLREQAEKADIPIVEKPLLGNGLLDKIRDVVRGRD
jgi:two-component system, LuxR family, response regulator FixJ